ncbi:MAG: glycosyltransferase family 39 protein, partial [Chloroflexi bacterium]|nr:glycosyltransferase family 39 protein [Chloroflexota bacterium]
GGWRLGLGASFGILLLAVSTCRSRGTLRAFLLINLGVLGIYLWAAAEREVLTVGLTKDDVRVQIARTDLTVGSRAVSGLVLVQAAEQIARRASQAPLLEPLPDILRRPLLVPQANLRAGVSLLEARGNARALSQRAGVLQAVQEAHETWLPVASVDAGDSLIEVELLRPSTMVRVLIGSDAPREGLLVEVRPEHRHLLLAEMVNGRIERQIAGGEYAYRPTTVSMIRRLAREVCRSWLWALTMLAVAGLAAELLPRRLTHRSPPARWGLGILVLAGLGATAFIASTVFEGIPHVTDSVAYLFQAKILALGRTWVPAPPLPEFFDHQHLILLDGRWFSKYAPGAALSLLPGVLAGQAWVTGPLLAALTILLTYDVGRRAYDRGVGLLAAGLLVVSPFFLFMSGSMMGHPFSLFLVMAVLAASARVRQGGPGWSLLAGLALGLLAMTRPLTALALALPHGLDLIGQLRGNVRRLVVVAILEGAGLAVPLAGWLVYNWSLTGDPLVNTMTLYWSFDRLGFGPDTGNLGGHDLALGLANLWANLLELNSYLFGWPVYLTLCPALIALLRPSRSASDWQLAAVAVMTTVVYVFWWFPGTIHGPRYAYEASGALALLTARGFAALATTATGAVSRRQPTLGASVVAALFLAGVLVYNAALYLPRELRTSHGYNGVDRGRLSLVQRAGLQNAVVFVSDRASGWQAYSSVFAANSPLLDGPVVYAHDLGPERNAQLLAQFPGRRGYLLDGGRLRALNRSVAP